jgi:ATP-dependent protease ClpP protease subunit
MRMRDDEQRRADVSLDHAHVSLLGEVSDTTVRQFLDQLAKAPTDEPAVIVEVTTPGGDAELARRLVLDIGIARKRMRRLVFVGKTQVYSAGITIMSAFPKQDRFLSRDCSLLIHCRQLDESVEISGAMRSNLPKARALVEQLETGLKLEEEDFRRLIEGSDVELGELLGKAVTNWYLPAAEAHRRGLVADLL